MVVCYRLFVVGCGLPFVVCYAVCVSVGRCCLTCVVLCVLFLARCSLFVVCGELCAVVVRCVLIAAVCS